MFYPPTLMKKSISLLAIFALALLAISHPVSSAAKKPVPGATCTKIKATQVFKGKKYTCIKSGKKLVWNKGVSVVKTPTPSATPTSSPSSSPSTSSSTSPSVTPTASPTPSTSASPTQSPTPTPTPTPTLTPTPTPTPSPTKVVYTMDKVKLNNTDRSCWSVVDGNVYDLTRWINSHPGGAGAIRSMCGVDGTRAFLNQHEGRREPIQRLSMYLLGPLSR